jgi:acetyl esterase/lipase
MNFGFLAITAALLSGCAEAQTQVWQPPPGHQQMPIWPGQVPDAQPTEKPESISVEKKELVAGKPWIAINDVSDPTITIYSPRGRNTEAAVVVFPGGGYHILAIDLEGTEICDWLTSRGITAVLLKYRVPRSGPHWDSKLRRHVQPKAPIALEDAQRAMRLVRYKCAELHVDPNKIGVIGFSAGGHLAAQLSTHFNKRLYPAMDAAETVSCRPDFAIAVYPGHLWSWTEHGNPNFDLNPDIANNITSRTPPTFLLQSEDDKVDDANDSLVYYIALKKAGVPVEMHLYPTGGHAFGLRRTKFAITAWPALVETWLNGIGILGR